MKAKDNGFGVLLPYQTEVVKITHRINAEIMIADAEDGFHEATAIDLPNRGKGRAPQTKTEPRKTYDEARRQAIMEIQQYLANVIDLDTDSVNVSAAKRLMQNILAIMPPGNMQLSLFG